MTLTIPRTWVVGEVVTAAIMNAEIRAQFDSLIAAQTSYIPAWTGTGVAIGNGIINGRYSLVGKNCVATVEMVFGTTSTVGSGAYSWSLPFLAASPSGSSANFVYCGAARGHAANWYGGTAVAFKGLAIAKIYNSASSAAEWGAAVPVAWAAAATNYIHFTIPYEIA